MKGTKRYGILLTPLDNFELIGYTDSDWAGSIDDMKNIFGYVFRMGLGAISWDS